MDTPKIIGGDKYNKRYKLSVTKKKLLFALVHGDFKAIAINTKRKISF